MGLQPASEPPAEILSGAEGESKDLASLDNLMFCTKPQSNQDFADHFFVTVDSRDFAEGMGRGTTTAHRKPDVLP